MQKEVGSLPLELRAAKSSSKEETAKGSDKEAKMKTKTIILPDGTYGVEIIEEDDDFGEAFDENKVSKTRKFLLHHSFFASIVM